MHFKIYNTWFSIPPITVTWADRLDGTEAHNTVSSSFMIDFVETASLTSGECNGMALDNCVVVHRWDTGALNRKCCHFDEMVVSECSQRWKVHPNYISVSVRMLGFTLTVTRNIISPNCTPGNPFAYPGINITHPFCYLRGKCSFRLI